MPLLHAGRHGNLHADLLMLHGDRVAHLPRHRLSNCEPANDDMRKTTENKSMIHLSQANCQAATSRRFGASFLCATSAVSSSATGVKRGHQGGKNLAHEQNHRHANSPHQDSLPKICHHVRLRLAQALSRLHLCAELPDRSHLWPRLTRPSMTVSGICTVRRAS